MNWFLLDRRILLATAGISIVYFVLWGLSFSGFDIPFIRQLSGLLVITFIPGYNILTILRIRGLGASKTTLFSVGLSLAYLMFIGAIANALLPILGIARPMSPTPIIAIIGISMSILFFLAYSRMQNPKIPPNYVAKNAEAHFSLNVLLFFILLPLLAALGAILVNSLASNFLLLILIPMVILIPIFVGFSKIIPLKMLPLAVVSIALTLLLHQALISRYLAGWDIHEEYYYQGLVIANGRWQWSIPNNLNAMLSITMLSPIYSYVLKINSLWILKIIYPLLFSIVPLALFEVYKDYWGAKRAFFASFVFISMLIFFTEMIYLGRQEIAEIFFSLLIVLIADRNLSPVKKSILAIIFLMSLTVSHYGLTYIALGIFGIAWSLIFLSKIGLVRIWYENLTSKLPFNSRKSHTYSLKTVSKPSLSSGYLLLFFIAFTLVWYVLISSGTCFNTIVNIGTSLYSNLIAFTSIHTREPLISTALGLDWFQASLAGKAFRLIQYVIEISTVISLFKVIFNYHESKIKLEYKMLAVGTGVVLLACVIIPYFSSYLNATRFFQIGLILLAPFCISGIEDIFKFFIRGLKLISIEACNYLFKPLFLYLFILIILIPYYLFNTGFIFEITHSSYMAGEMPSSMALSNYRVDFPDYNFDEALAAQWLTQYFDNQIRVYSDLYGHFILDDYLYTKVDTLPDNLDEMVTTNYIYLRSWNIVNQERVLASGDEINLSDTSKLNNLVKNENLVYDNGYTEIIAPLSTH